MKRNVVIPAANLILAAVMLGALQVYWLIPSCLLLVAFALVLIYGYGDARWRRVLAFCNGGIVIGVGLSCARISLEEFPVLAAAAVFTWLLVWSVWHGREAAATSLFRHRQRLSVSVSAFFSLVLFWYGLHRLGLQEISRGTVMAAAAGTVSCFGSWIGLHPALTAKRSLRWGMATGLFAILAGGLLVSSGSAQVVAGTPIAGRIMVAGLLSQLIRRGGGRQTRRPRAGGNSVLDPTNPAPDKRTVSKEPRVFLMLTRDALAQGAKPPFYIRRKAFDHYNGKRWSCKDPGTVWYDDANDGVEDGWIRVNEPPREQVIDHFIFIPQQRTHEMVSLPGACAVGVPLLMKGPNESFLIPVREGQNVVYPVRSSWYSYADIRGKPVRPARVAPGYRQLPDTPVMSRIRKHARTVMAPGKTPAAKLHRLMQYMSVNYGYSDEYYEPRKDAVEEFLFERREGHCTLHATALALMLRSEGFPTRVAMGYYGGTFDRRGSVFYYSDRDLHAWTEVCLEDYGWVLVDATPGSVGKVATISDSGFSDRAEDYDFLGNTRLGLDLTQMKQRRAPLLSAAHQRQITASFLVALVLVGVWGLVFLWRRVGGRDARRQAPTRPAAPPFFQLFCRLFSQRGYPKRRSQTAFEYAAELRRHGLINGEFDAMLDYYYGIRYAGLSSDPKREQAFIDEIRRLARCS